MLTAYLFAAPLKLPMTPGPVITHPQGPLSSEHPTRQAVRVPAGGLTSIFFPALVGAPAGTTEVLNVEARIADSTESIWRRSVSLVSQGGDYQAVAIEFDPIPSSDGLVLDLSFAASPGSVSPIFLGSSVAQGVAAGPLRIGPGDRFPDAEISMQLIRETTLAAEASESLRTRPHVLGTALGLAVAAVGMLWLLSGHMPSIRRLAAIDRGLGSLLVTVVAATALVQWWY